MEKICSAAGLQMIADFFEFMGEYVKTRLLDHDEILAAYPAEWSWTKMEPWVSYTRELSGIEDLYGTFE